MSLTVGLLRKTSRADSKSKMHGEIQSHRQINVCGRRGDPNCCLPYTYPVCWSGDVGESASGENGEEPSVQSLLRDRIELCRELRQVGRRLGPLESLVDSSVVGEVSSYCASKGMGERGLIDYI